MSKKSTSTAPECLSDAGRALWDSIAPKYQFRPDETARLLSICKTADMVAMLEAAWIEKGCPTETRGSMGQEIIHPLIGELRAQRAAYEGALIRLKLPDDVSSVDVNQHRSAANSSWAPGAARGRGA